MKVHFICRGNVLRSLIAETYLRSLHIPDVTATSSGTNVDLSSQEERMFFANTIALFKRHNIEQYAKHISHQLTQERADGQDITVCMNQRVVDEARTIVRLPANTLNWSIVDIGEGNRIVSEDIRTYEEEIFQEIVAHVDELVERALSPSS
jgi:protein-tyrosine-phosphatase